MSNNIHTLGRPSSRPPASIRSAFSQQRKHINPKNEHFALMLKNVLCPTLTKRSFITLITVVQSLTFLVVTTGSLFLTGGLSN